MPLYAQEHLDIPVSDILTWCHSNRSTYDQTRPLYTDCNDYERTLSAEQIWGLIPKLVAGFRAKGLRRGDSVCLHAFNDLYYPVLVQGIIGAGCCFVATNPSYKPFELAHALKISKAKLIIAGTDVVSSISEVAAEHGVSDDNILLLAPTDDVPELRRYHSWRTLLQHGAEPWVSFNDYETARTTNAFLLFSSGTTGVPKAAQLSHYNLIAEHTMLSENPKHLSHYDMKRIAVLPFFHVAAAPGTFISVLRSGIQTAIMRRFDLVGWLHHMRRFNSTDILLVPPMIAGLLQYARTQPEYVRECLRTVRHGWSSAAPLSEDLRAAFQQLLPVDASFTQCWAMSETASAACIFYPGVRDETGSVGRFMPNIDVKLVDEQGQEVGPCDAPGELCVRGPNVVRGYLDDAAANARDWDADGFFHTGDVLLCDGKTGKWYVVDRKKELIKVRGFQVAPSELEAVLLRHPDVLDAAVIGDARHAGRELPMAYVVKREESVHLNEDDILRWMNDHLAKYKQLEGGVRFVASIPKSVAGKILRNDLRAMAKETSAKL